MIVSSTDYEKNIMEMAKKAFSKHEMRKIGPGHWRIKRLESSRYWTDIVVMGPNMGLAVWGDIDGCFFAYCSGASKPEDVVKWMANASLDYVAEKARIGSTDYRIVHEYEPEVALYDLEVALKGLESAHEREEWERVDTKGSSLKSIYEDAFSAAKRAINYDEPVELVLEELCETLQNSGVDDAPSEWVYHIGRVVNLRVIYAVAAISHLYKLLEAEERI